jgi:hypothetical protein
MLNYAGFMKEFVNIVFYIVCLLAVTPTAPAYAESVFLPAARSASKVSNHLDIAVVIQPALFVRVDWSKKLGVGQETGISSATVTVQGNSGSVMLQPGSAESATESSEMLDPVMMIASRKIVNASQNMLPTNKPNVKPPRTSASSRVVWTVSQL